MADVQQDFEIWEEVNEIERNGIEMAQLNPPCNWSDLKTHIIDELTLLLYELNELQTFQFMFDTQCCVQQRVVKCKGSLFNLLMSAGFDLKCHTNQFNLENWRKQKYIEIEDINRKYNSIFSPFGAPHGLKALEEIEK